MNIIADMNKNTFNKLKRLISQLEFEDNIDTIDVHFNYGIADNITVTKKDKSTIDIKVTVMEPCWNIVSYFYPYTTIYYKYE